MKPAVSLRDRFRESTREAILDAAAGAFNDGGIGAVRMEDIAAAVLESIRLVQPNGPYQLAGYSFGGLLAYEIAQQLTAAGETVSMLAIYDTYTPAGRTERPRWQRAALHACLLATRPGSHLRHLRGQLKRRRDAAARSKRLPAQDAAPAKAVAAGSDDRLHDLSRVNARAASAYRPKPYPGSVLLFRATDRAAHNLFYKSDPNHGWGALAGGGVRVIDLPGTHLRLLDAAHAPAAADALRPHLISCGQHPFSIDASPSTTRQRSAPRFGG